MAFRDFIEAAALWVLKKLRPEIGLPPVPRGSCGVIVGPRGVSYFGPDEEDWDDQTGSYAVLSMALLILVRDADLNRSIAEALVQASIELDLGQEMGQELAASFIRREHFKIAA